MWKALTMITLFLTSSLASAHDGHEAVSALHAFNHLVSVNPVYLLSAFAAVFTCVFLYWNHKRRSW